MRPRMTRARLRSGSTPLRVPRCLGSLTFSRRRRCRPQARDVRRGMHRIRKSPEDGAANDRGSSAPPETLGGVRRSSASGGALDAPAGNEPSPLKEVEMQGRNWKLAMLLATTVGVMATGSSLALAQSTTQQLPHSARDPDIARQEPKGLHDPDRSEEHTSELQS